MDIRGYLQHARKLPLRVTLRKSVGWLRRMGRAVAQLALDTAVASYGASGLGFNSSARIEIAVNDIPADLRETLRQLSGEYLQHRFDLLGSGWVSPVYGFNAGGFLGHCYRPAGPRAPTRNGHGLESVVNRANLSRSRTKWKLIRHDDYVPIDWQLDFRSGYRWSARRPSRCQAIPLDQGADIKVPWELARLQHLPQLALCAILAQGRVTGFEPATRYLDEISDQLADFIATNPPRFGVNWLGVMDVAIRAANISLTLALLAGAGLPLPPETNSAVAAALDDHGKHVAEHLEYSEIGRGNHYVADLGGLLWASWLLDGEEADRRLIFAIAEILKEADHQFLADGGNYEGSVNYHRLSGEIVLFALALIGGLDQRTLARLERARPPRRAWRVGFPDLPLRRHRSAKSGIGLVPAQVLRKMKAAADLTRAVQGSDDMIIQIGDTDSGRFFKLHPTSLPDKNNFAENNLDHGGFVDAVDVLFGAAPQGWRLDAVVVQRLAGVVVATQAAQQRQSVVADFGDLDALMERWQAAPEASRRVRHIPLGTEVTSGGWTRASFPDFGLYLFRHDDLLISFRCHGAPHPAAPTGHHHDDNLCVEYRLGAAQCRDPGSFIYTPSVKERNRYRAAAAHDVPRVRGQSLADAGNALFELKLNAYARCLYWQPNGVAGEVICPSGAILRILHITSGQLSIYDCVAPPAEIESLSPALPVSLGYGRN